MVRYQRLPYPTYPWETLHPPFCTAHEVRVTAAARNNDKISTVLFILWYLKDDNKPGKTKGVNDHQVDHEYGPGCSKDTWGRSGYKESNKIPHSQVLHRFPALWPAFVSLKIRNSQSLTYNYLHARIMPRPISPLCATGQKSFCPYLLTYIV